ncbi:protein NO VEIN-like [Pyrus x bretschneideri]|uniref:protein NO VEIN-like n=1 Tax=Pyrus x bretschneideri TaxID=225117 RepID=UPI00202F24DB|nr:protein NO VEIN-like [Pyrus x bretschneideri]
MQCHSVLLSKLHLNREWKWNSYIPFEKFLSSLFQTGTYGAVDEGPIWLHFDALKTEFEGQHGLESFPDLYAKLRIVNPGFLIASCADVPSVDVTTSDKVTSMLRRIGVQQLSAHEIINEHILPDISDDRFTDSDKNLMNDYICFVMVHLQLDCYDCRSEREYIISELGNKAYILTNGGFKRPAEASIHFSKAFGNPFDINKLIDGVDLVWHEIDISYLKHPATRSLPSGLMKWREFFQKIGVTDFVKVVQVEKGISSLSDALLNELMFNKDIISHGLNATDWESPELVQLLTLLSGDDDKKGCEYLLEVLDTLWDDCYSDKTTGYCISKSVADRWPFRSSFISSICDVQWVVSTMDDELHYSKTLYHNCHAVRSILGASAPYSVPKVRSGKFASDIGFKTRISLGDVLEILKLWRCEKPFRASLAQMFKFYSLVWNEMAPSKQIIMDEFHSGPSIFVPYQSGFSHEDVVSGVFLSPEEVYWDDSSNFIKAVRPEYSSTAVRPVCSSTAVNHIPLNKMLRNFYPGLHDFFVGHFGVHETPPFRSYLQILLDLSNVALPSQAAIAVFQVLLKWTDGLKSGSSAEDILYLKRSLTKIECTVLPTVQDKWVSLHPSFGFVCWCDDLMLRQQFTHLDGVHFLYFGELSHDDVEMLFKKVSILLKALGIPALSEAVTRQALFSGLGDCSFKAALLDWALPYAQRYLQSVHPDKYTQLKHFGFDIVNRLQVVVVEKLFYQNVIKSFGIKSKKRLRCSCLLQGSTLYTNQEPDSHALFVELSRLLFDGIPELHLANFLHMITIMAESGSTEEQTEFFILNSQKVPKLSGGESVWSLPSVRSLTDNYKSLQSSVTSTEINEESCSKSKRKAIKWPPVDWKTAPVAQFSSALEKEMHDDSGGIIGQLDNLTPGSVDINWTIEDDSATTSAALVMPDFNDLQEHCGAACNETDNRMRIEFDPINLGFVSDPPEMRSSSFSQRDQPRHAGTSSGRDGRDAMLTGRLGELVAFKYLIAKAGKSVVKWVNECNETGLPYDIVIREKEDSTEFIEVKATQFRTKDWFRISMREWQFAVEKGEAFSILHVILLGNNAARVSVYKNPVKLCQSGKLHLNLSMPKHHKELFLLS